MNTLGKIKKSWWVLLSFIMFINGFGFIYIGTKHNNKNWILEGVIYELPWFLYMIMFRFYGFSDSINETSIIVLIALIIMFIGIIRSIWVAVKLVDVYDNVEKYTIQSSVLYDHNVPKDNNSSLALACCSCLIVLFLFFAIFAL